jgi:hypothetical protein
MRKLSSLNAVQAAFDHGCPWKDFGPCLRRIRRLGFPKLWEEPTAGILDSQSVKTALEAESRGYDAGKKVKGRERHVLVDILGMVLVAWITTADMQDRDAAAMLPLAAERFPTLQKVWADAGYEGLRVQAFAQQSGIEVEIVKRSDQVPGDDPTDAGPTCLSALPQHPLSEGSRQCGGLLWPRPRLGNSAHSPVACPRRGGGLL